MKENWKAIDWKEKTTLEIFCCILLEGGKESIYLFLYGQRIYLPYDYTFYYLDKDKFVLYIRYNNKNNKLDHI
jgi:hypothetical protein